MRFFAFDLNVNFSDFGFAEQAARFRQFDAVRDRVPKQMQKRFDQRIENLRVNLQTFAFDVKFGLLVFFIAGDAGGAAQTGGKRTEFDHSDSQKFILHFFDQATLRLK